MVHVINCRLHIKISMFSIVVCRNLQWIVKHSIISWLNTGALPKLSVSQYDKHPFCFLSSVQETIYRHLQVKGEYKWNKIYLLKEMWFWGKIISMPYFYHTLLPKSHVHHREEYKYLKKLFIWRLSFPSWQPSDSFLFCMLLNCHLK